MMKSVTVINHLGESIEIELSSPEKSGFIVQSIEGLGPTKADNHMIEMATLDGSIDNSSRRTSRNIKLKLIFFGVPSIEDVRMKSYKFFPTKQPVTLIFETDSRVAFATGRVLTNTPDVFSKQEGCTVEVEVPSAYFYSLGKQQANFNGVEAEFEFPFSNESDDQPLLEFGNILQYTEHNIYYEGDAEVGIQLYIHALGTIRGLSIYNITSRERMTISDDKYAAIVGSEITNGDEIFIRTVKGEKYIRVLRNGVYYNILNALDKNVDWFQLAKGDNVFAYTATYGIESVEMKITNDIAYVGV